MARLSRGRRMALRVLADNPQRRAVPVDVKGIAENHAHILFDDLGPDVSGMLVPLGGEIDGKKWAIVVHTGHSSVRQRFTLAHELGHLLLHEYGAPHVDQGYHLRVKETVKFRDSKSSEGSVVEEIEANQFAAELLMPKAAILKELVRRRVEYAPQEDEAGEKLLREIAAKFEVSQQALAIRISTLVA